MDETPAGLYPQASFIRIKPGQDPLLSPLEKRALWDWVGRHEGQVQRFYFLCASVCPSVDKVPPSMPDEGLAAGINVR